MHLRVEAFGAVDELNAALGIAAAASDERELRALGRVGSRRALRARRLARDAGRGAPRVDGLPSPAQRRVAELERQIDALRSRARAARALRVRRAARRGRRTARRARRLPSRGALAVELDRDESLAPNPHRYLNRLSDLLFVMARVANRRAGVADLEWEGIRR